MLASKAFLQLKPVSSVDITHLTLKRLINTVSVALLHNYTVIHWLSCVTGVINGKL